MAKDDEDYRPIHLDLRLYFLEFSVLRISDIYMMCNSNL